MNRYSEPWRVDEDARLDGGHQICTEIDGKTMTIAFMSTGWKNQWGLANAERIVACVNACADIENPAGLKEAIDMLRALYITAELCTQSGRNETWERLRDSLSETLDKLDGKPPTNAR